VGVGRPSKETPGLEAASKRAKRIGVRRGREITEQSREEKFASPFAGPTITIRRTQRGKTVVCKKEGGINARNRKEKGWYNDQQSQAKINQKKKLPGG